ncbi:MAG: hypothetical protein HKM04_00690 [Legionellales bacterium]|nr:hypothetical protein [Legionellales bacterium]
MTISTESVILLISALFVFWKLIGLTCFTAGLVRSRNTNDILAKNVVLLALSIAFFILVTQHLVFSNGINAYIPTFTHHLPTPALPGFEYTRTLFELFMPIIPLYIISGATAERLRFWPFLLFSLFYLGLIYPTVAYWTWGSGFLHQVGFIDYGGAAVLHISGAVASIACLVYLGSRKGHYDQNKKLLPQPGANIPLAMLGAMLIWFGSIGLNVGTALIHAPQGLLVANLSLVILNTLIAGSAGLLGALLLTRIIYGTIDITLLFNGALAGIVAISANPIIVNSSIVALIGLIAGILCMFAIMTCRPLGIDDPIGAIPVHGIGGLWGIISASFTYYISGVQNTGVDWSQLGLQSLGVICIITWVFVTSLIVWSIIRFSIGLRIKPTDEFKGMDIITCGMNAYPEFIIPGQEKS